MPRAAARSGPCYRSRVGWIAIGNADDFLDGTATPVTVGERRLVAVRVGADVFVIEDRCPHRGFPLHDGTVRGATITCRTHGACFALPSGAAVRGPARRGVRTHAVRVTDGMVSIDVEHPRS